MDFILSFTQLTGTWNCDRCEHLGMLSNGLDVKIGDIGIVFRPDCQPIEQVFHSFPGNVDQKLAVEFRFRNHLNGFTIYAESATMNTITSELF